MESPKKTEYKFESKEDEELFNRLPLNEEGKQEFYKLLLANYEKEKQKKKSTYK